MNDRDLLTEALNRTDPAARATFLDQACAGAYTMRLTPPTRPSQRSDVMVSSEVDINKKVTPAPGSMPSSKTAASPKNLESFSKRMRGFARVCRVEDIE